MQSLVSAGETLGEENDAARDVKTVKPPYNQDIEQRWRKYFSL